MLGDVRIDLFAQSEKPARSSCDRFRVGSPSCEGPKREFAPRLVKTGDPELPIDLVSTLYPQIKAIYFYSGRPGKPVRRSNRIDLEGIAHLVRN